VLTDKHTETNTTTENNTKLVVQVVTKKQITMCCGQTKYRAYTVVFGSSVVFESFGGGGFEGGIL